MLIGYARVSKSTGQDTGLQLDALRKAGCEKIFEEAASGAQRDRPELAKALAFARESDVLVVWKMDRLARSLRQLIETVEALGERGIGFQSVTEKIDTESPSGRLFFHVIGAMAEFERATLRERVQAGLQHARDQGRVGGRPRKMSVQDLAKAKAMLTAPEITVEAVAATLGVSASTLYRSLPGGRQAL